METKLNIYDLLKMASDIIYQESGDKHREVIDELDKVANSLKYSIIIGEDELQIPYFE